MIMTMRWYGSCNDSVTLEQIKQIPNIKGVVGGLHNIPVGEVWRDEDITSLKSEVEGAGLTLEVIESVNIHEEIKLGSEKRDYYIDNYIKTLRVLGKYGIKVVCYNFMPVFDWTRSSVDTRLEDGSEVLDYDENIISKMNGNDITEYMLSEAKDFTLPGWEPERLSGLTELFDRYKNVTEDDLRSNLKYFLERVIPVCEEVGISMAIHPDDPPWNIFGLPRIARNHNDFNKIINLVYSKNNGITLCTGCLGASKDNDIPEMIKYFGEKGRIHFTHLRNIKFYGDKSFHEVSHLSSDGDLDMYKIVKAYHDLGYKGYIRPDHGRMIWGEKARPGYGLYDRALGITYINGIIESLDKQDSNK